MPDRDLVFLVPGFFGFINLGDIAYFAHVRDFLLEHGARLGLDAEVRVVKTYPTASLRRRAARVLEAIAEATPPGADARIHLVGHSSGGLDARLLASPGASLATTLDLEPYARRIRSVVTVAAPHLGTPLAGLFASVFGQSLLRVLSLATIYSLRTGRLPIRAVAQLVRFLVAPHRLLGGAETALDQVYHQLLGDFSLERRQTIEEFFRSVGTEQDLLAQLGPSAMDVFDAATRDRDGVRYGCVVTRARPPGLRSLVGAGASVYGQATHALYLALHRLAGRMPPARAPQPPGPGADARAAALRRAFRDEGPGWRDNDGIVPTLSQLRGDVVAATWGDHLDVIGHFHHPTHVPPHFDWLASGSGFGRPDFEAVWTRVVRYLAGAPPSADSSEPVEPAAGGERRRGDRRRRRRRR